jgi:hypothetical protein
MANRIAHSSDLTVAALMNREAENSGTNQCSLGRRSETVFEYHALPKYPKFAASRLTLDVGDVFLLDTERRVSQPMSEISIIGKQQETFCIHVKAANRKHARFLRNKFKNGRTTVRIVGGRDHTNRLIEEQMHKSWSNADDDAVDGDLVIIGIDTTP